MIQKDVPINELIYFLKDWPGLEGCAKKFDSLPKEADMIEVFKIIDDELASYLHYEIFQYLSDKYCDSKGDSAAYSEHLKNYIEQLDIKHYIDINPELKKFHCADESRKLFLKMDIDQTTKFTKIKELEDSIATILRSISKEAIRPSQIKLIDVKKGCLTLTYLISAVVADTVFAAYERLSEDHIASLRSLSVLSLNFRESEIDCGVGKWMCVH